MLRRTSAQKQPVERYGHLDQGKLRAIDAAFRHVEIKALADLGGAWAVDGAYSVYALREHKPNRVVLVDEEPTPAVWQLAHDISGFELMEENFGSRAMTERLGRVDAVLLFDVLLHQVAPDWDAIVRMYAPLTSCFVIANPQYGGSQTVRLVELGPDRYWKLVPPQPAYSDLFDRADEFLPERRRRYCDIHNVWQWGITDGDLCRLMDSLGFKLRFFEDNGPWRGMVSGSWVEFPAFSASTYVFAE